MINISKTGKTVFIVFSCLMALGVSPAFAQTPQSCIPSCEENDGKFIAMLPASFDLSTLSGEPIRIEIITDEDQLQFGIFDADHSGFWDRIGEIDSNISPITENLISYTVYADRNRTGDSAGLPVVATFRSDDSEALDNNWRDITLDHDPAARDGQGDYNYLLEVIFFQNTRPGFVMTSFKVRALGEVFMVPNNNLGISARLQDDEVNLILDHLATIYPLFDNCDFNLLPNILSCGGLCDSYETCTAQTTYDGEMSIKFLVDVPPGEVINEFVLWDGDFDHGNGLQNSNDTDDPDTPNEGVPPFNTSPFTVPERASLVNDPLDDAHIFNEPPAGDVARVIRRVPAVIYELVSSDGDVYSNSNPSGTEEWERFSLRLNDHPDGGCVNTGDEPTADFCVDNIPAGVWTVNIMGLDMENIVFLRNEFSTMSVEPVPAMTRWGMMVMIALFGMVILLTLRTHRA